jgi:hypothetical protein
MGQAPTTAIRPSRQLRNVVAAGLWTLDLLPAEGVYAKSSSIIPRRYSADRPTAIDGQAMAGYERCGT